ncbi:SMI1/KNR4 family protein [Chitinophaga ginsengisoli]|uniref:Knr4/Smi1-like domain-containing protein n=1 Tax=Chitinophaga ginsengisoli TaxID=363837 RepID=A0A2P8GLX0_9BACT|nr:SMI1/KNR4 family protein [Chitinophaga ginsengisoli]PSL34962.1 hypothetical protein CLV42_102536 [Chitinophaga ginsengisoli]
MTNSEKIQQFRQLYTATNALYTNLEEDLSQIHNERDVDQIVSNIDKMISLLPISFPKGGMQSTSASVLLINPDDPADVPAEKVVKKNGMTSYILPEDTIVVYENTLLIVLEDRKFRTWNYATILGNSGKYKSLMLAQAKKCMTLFPDKGHWQSWEEDMMVLYANQIGWYAFEEEEDVTLLEEALQTLERGYRLSNRDANKYIKDAKVRLLLKLNRPDEAYAIVSEVLSGDPAYADFQDLKKDKEYIRWNKAETQRKKEAHKAYLQSVKDEKARVTDQFIYPDHPLVKQHAAILNTIKQRMAEIRLETIYHKQQENETVTEDFELRKWSLDELDAFEVTNGFVLPGEYKVYLMEIGSGGDVYFQMDEVPGIDAYDDEVIDQIKRPFPITSAKIHDVGDGVMAWVYPDDEEWEDTFDGNMEALFGLPDNAEITDGCLPIGYSWGQNELFLIANGEFEGEVWSDTLQYGAEARGCFGAASEKRLKFLEFIAGSVHATLVGYDEAPKDGDWL